MKHEHSDEAELAALIKKGSQLAFVTIFDRYNKPLYVLAFRYLKNREMAEDAVQQIFINLWVKRENINPDLNLKSLLFTSLKNHSLNVIRDQQKTIEKNYEILTESMFDKEIDTADESLEMITLIEKAVETLSPQRRQIYYLKIVKGYSNQEIATSLDISINTVKVQYYHILKEIREFVGKNMGSFILLISYLFR